MEKFMSALGVLLLSVSCSSPGPFMRSQPSEPRTAPSRVERDAPPQQSSPATTESFQEISDHVDERFESWELIESPSGWTVEKFASGLTYPTGATWDSAGRLWVSESGGGMAPFMIATPRLVRISPGGSAESSIDLSAFDVHSPVNDVTWHDGWLYFSHRLPDLSGGVSRIRPDGSGYQNLVRDLPSWFEHQTNEIVFDAGGTMYIAQGPPTNSGVAGPDIAPWVKAYPKGAVIPCQDIVLTGRNFYGENFLTPKENDHVSTGAFVPFGVLTTSGQRIKGGAPHCAGAVLSARPDGSSLEVVAWGFRNVFGLAFGPDGKLYASQNGMDMRGLRPAEHDKDAFYRVRPGEWYGWPDYTGELKPITSMSPPDRMLATGHTGLEFVIDHKASGLDAPDQDLMIATFQHHSATTKFDFAPESWKPCAGVAYFAQWGDLAPPTGPLHGPEPLGFKVVSVDMKKGSVHEVLRNKYKGPGSRYGSLGRGLERPIEVKFGPDGAMYVLDFGQALIDLDKSPPYVYPPRTGMIWRVNRTGNECRLPEQGKSESGHSH